MMGVLVRRGGLLRIQRGRGRVSLGQIDGIIFVISWGIDILGISQDKVRKEPTCKQESLSRTR
jgi:hypothetical protein